MNYVSGKIGDLGDWDFHDDPRLNKIVAACASKALQDSLNREAMYLDAILTTKGVTVTTYFCTNEDDEHRVTFEANWDGLVDEMCETYGKTTAREIIERMQKRANISSKL